VALLRRCGQQDAAVKAAQGAQVRKIYVDTLRLITDSGAKRPRFTKHLRVQLRESGFDVVEPNVDASGTESRPPDAGPDIFSVEKLVLSRSQLTPPVLGFSNGAADMEVAAVLVRPGSSAAVKLGPFAVLCPHGEHDRY
jgi:hypothetical protein